MDALRGVGMLDGGCVELIIVSACDPENLDPATLQALVDVSGVAFGISFLVPESEKIRAVPVAVGGRGIVPSPASRDATIRAIVTYVRTTTHLRGRRLCCALPSCVIAPCLVHFCAPRSWMGCTRAWLRGRHTPVQHSGLQRLQRRCWMQLVCMLCAPAARAQRCRVAVVRDSSPLPADRFHPYAAMQAIRTLNELVTGEGVDIHALVLVRGTLDALPEPSPAQLEFCDRLFAASWRAHSQLKRCILLLSAHDEERGVARYRLARSGAVAAVAASESPVVSPENACVRMQRVLRAFGQPLLSESERKVYCDNAAVVPGMCVSSTGVTGSVKTRVDHLASSATVTPSPAGSPPGSLHTPALSPGTGEDGDHGDGDIDSPK